MGSQFFQQNHSWFNPSGFVSACVCLGCVSVFPPVLFCDDPQFDPSCQLIWTSAELNWTDVLIFSKKRFLCRILICMFHRCKRNKIEHTTAQNKHVITPPARSWFTGSMKQCRIYPVCWACQGLVWGCSRPNRTFQMSLSIAKLFSSSCGMLMYIQNHMRSLQEVLRPGSQTCPDTLLRKVQGTT